MIPDNTEYTIEDEIVNDFEEESIPDKTYWMNRENKRIVGTCDGEIALEQAAYKILSTERGEYPVYSEDYGIEISDLFGKDMIYAASELPSRIEEGLLQDDRFSRIDDMTVQRFGTKLSARYTLVTADDDEIEMEDEVDV